METLATCPLCHSEGKSSLLHQHGDARCVLCENCGLAYLNPRMSHEERIRFYSDSYQRERHKLSDIDAAIARAREPHRYAKKRVWAGRFVPHLNTSSRVLEIGAGYGMLLAAIRELTGASVSGIEPGVIGSEVARRVFSVPVLNTDLDTFARATVKDHYDCIIMSHVLEHLPSPIESLRAIQSLLAPKAALWIAVPNILTPDDAPDRFFHFEHLFYFSPRTLVRTLEEAGYAVVHVERRPREIIMRAVLAETEPLERIRSTNCPGAPEHVRRRQQLHAFKYDVLRFFGRAVESVCPPRYTQIVRARTVSLLRHIGLIKQ
jgi:2-polyprenyl-3-methyl-5-hydroxy-6-metoxy-1,4-benzoquinol methylase